ncbi:MAG: arsenate reductase ArsC [Ilumatobacteraceae bacterium]|jgi:protein-tyrosine-phosphatase
MSEHALVDPVLQRSSSRLAEEFIGVFAPETVDRCVGDSYRHLAASATVATYLPLLAQRFARERLQAAARAADRARVGSAAVLFVCSHNSGRSQIAAAWLRHLAPHIEVWSAGANPASEVSPAVVAAMREVGIELTGSFPKPLTDEVIAGADVVVTMGCGEACPVVPGRRYEDWILAHPVGATVDEVRSARDEIRERVEALIGTFRTVAR